jgi:hypothetical protein
MWAKVKFTRLLLEMFAHRRVSVDVIMTVIDSTTLYYITTNKNTFQSHTYPFICLSDQATYQAGYDPESAVSTERPEFSF